MALADVRDILLPWEQSGTDAQKKIAKQLESGIDHIRELKSDMFSRIKKGGEITTLKKEWMEANTYQNTITGKLATSTITFSGNLMGAAITDESMRQHIRTRTVLERNSDGLQVIVSSTAADVNYTAFTAVVAAHGNSGSLSDDATATTYTILGAALSDYDDTFIPLALDRTFRWCGTRQVKYNYEQPWTKDSLKMENISDEMAYQVQEIIKELYQKQALAVLRDRPVYSAGNYVSGFSTASPTLHGVCFWPSLLYGEDADANLYKNNSSVAIQDEDMNNLAYNLMYTGKADFNSGDWVFACHPVTGLYIDEFGRDDRRFEFRDNKYGYRNQTFASKVGKDFEILRDPNIRPDVFMLVDLSAFSWGYLKGQGVKVTELAEDNTNVHKKKITSYMWGTMVRNPRSKIAMIYGLPTTYA